MGCGKKAAPQSSQTNAAAVQPQTAPAPVPATTAPSPAANQANSYDAEVTARSIDYLQSQVARKNWPQARLALKHVEERSLTSEQRGHVDSLKAQITPGR